MAASNLTVRTMQHLKCLELNRSIIVRSKQVESVLAQVDVAARCRFVCGEHFPPPSGYNCFLFLSKISLFCGENA